jgi:hypothetical protein
MMQTATMTPAPQRLQAEPQRLRALERANEVRLARAELKRRIAEGELCAAEVILTNPPEVATWTVGELLRSQRRWGGTRCRKFLGRNQISEVKRIETLTERQRHLLVAQLGSSESVDREMRPGSAPPFEYAGAA